MHCSVHRVHRKSLWLKQKPRTQLQAILCNVVTYCYGDMANIVMCCVHLGLDTRLARAQTSRTECSLAMNNNYFLMASGTNLGERWGRGGKGRGGGGGGWWRGRVDRTHQPPPPPPPPPPNHPPSELKGLINAQELGSKTCA